MNGIAELVVRRPRELVLGISFELQPVDYAHSYTARDIKKYFAFPYAHKEFSSTLSGKHRHSPVSGALCKQGRFMEVNNESKLLSMAFWLATRRSLWECP